MILILRGKRLGFSLREIKDYLDLYDVDHTQAEQLRAAEAGGRQASGLATRAVPGAAADDRRTGRRAAPGRERPCTAIAGSPQSKLNTRECRNGQCRHRRLRTLAVHPGQEGCSGAGARRRHGRRGDTRPDRQDRREAGGYRGHRRGLRLPRGRAGDERGTPDRPAGRPAAQRRRHDGEPVLRQLDEQRAHRRRPDSDGRRRGIHRRGYREHEPGADGRLQPDVQHHARRQEPRRLYGHGRDGRERRPQMADHPRPAGGFRCRQPPEGVRRAGGRQVPPTRSCRSTARAASWTRMAAYVPAPPRKHSPG